MVKYISNTAFGVFFKKSLQKNKRQKECIFLNNMLSRNERLWETLLKVANQGRWSYQTTLYSSEIRRIQKQWGVFVHILKDENSSVSCIITWCNAFPDGMDYRQSWYISKIIDEMPEVNTPAQELFLITARA